MKPLSVRAWIVGISVLIASIAGAAWVAAKYRQDLQAARARIATGSTVAPTACGPIEYAEAGSGPAVLVVHGAGGGFDQGLDFAGDLAASGFRVIAVSRFGYLRTPLPADASAAAQADAHACLLDALEIPSAAVIGASAGAPSSLQFALRHPARCTALALLVPAAYVPRPENAPSLRTPPGTQALFDTALRSDFLFWAAAHAARDTVLRSILATPAELVRTAPREEQARVSRMLEHILPVTPRRLGLLNDAAVTSNLRREALENVTAPTLVISLKDDQFGTLDGARYTASKIPGAQLIQFDTGGHVWVGHHAEVMALLRRHLLAT